MALVGFRFEPVSLDVNKCVLKKNRISLIRVKNQEKVKALLNGANVENETVMHTNVEYVSCGEI